MENFTAVLNGQRYTSRAGRLRVSPEPVETPVQESPVHDVQENFQFLIPDGARVVHYSLPPQDQPGQSDQVEDRETEKRNIKEPEDVGKWLLEFMRDFNKSLMYS